LEESEEFEWCFNNFDEITTTTPSGARNDFGKFKFFVVVFVGILKAIMNFGN